MIGRKITDQTVSCKVIKAIPLTSKSIPSTVINPLASMHQTTINQNNPLQTQIQPFQFQSLSNQSVPISGRVFGVSKQTLQAEIDFGIENYNCFNRLNNDYYNDQTTNQGKKQQKRGGSRNVTHYFISNKEKPINVESKKIVHSAQNIPQTNIQIKNSQPLIPNQNEDHHPEKTINSMIQRKEKNKIKSIKQMKQFNKQPTKTTINNHTSFTNTKQKGNDYKQSKIEQKKNIGTRQSSKSIHKNQKSYTTSIVAKQSNLLKTKQSSLIVTKQSTTIIKQKPQQQSNQQTYLQQGSSCHFQVNVEGFISNYQKSENPMQDGQSVTEGKQQIRQNTVLPQSKFNSTNQQNNNKRVKQPLRYMSVKEQIEQELRKRAHRQIKPKSDLSKSDKFNNLLFKKSTCYPEKSQNQQKDKQEEHYELDNREEEEIEQQRMNVPEPIQKMVMDQKIGNGDYKIKNGDTINPGEQMKGNEKEKQDPTAKSHDGGQKQQSKERGFNYVQQSSDQEKSQPRIGLVQEVNEGNGENYESVDEDEEYEDYQYSLQRQTKNNCPIGKTNNHTVHQSSFCQQEELNYQPSHTLYKQHHSKPSQQYSSQQQNQQQQGSQQQQSQQDNPKITEYLRQRNLLPSNSNKYPKSINQNILSHHQNIQSNDNNIEVILQLDEEYLQSSIILHQSHSSPHNNLSSTNHNLNQLLPLHKQLSQQPYSQGEVPNYYTQFTSSSSDSQQPSHHIPNCTAPPFITPHSDQVFLPQNDTAANSSLSGDKQLSELFTLNIGSLLSKDFINLDR